MAVMNDRTSVVAFYRDDNKVMHCTETYSNAKALIFGCKTMVVFVLCEKNNSYYSNKIEAWLDSEGTDGEFMTIEVTWDGGPDIYNFYPNGRIEREADKPT